MPSSPMQSMRVQAAACGSLFLHALLLLWMSVHAGHPVTIPASTAAGPPLVVSLQPRAMSVPGHDWNPAAPAMVAEAPASHAMPASDANNRSSTTVSDNTVMASDDMAPLFPMLETSYLPARELDTRPYPEMPVILPFPDAPLAKPKVAAVLLLYIGEDGAVHRVELEDSDLPPEFEASALNAFRGARMQPGMKDGKSTRALMKILVEFESR